MTPEEFLGVWESLATPVTNQELRAHEAVPGAGVWVARDNSDHQHLLVLVDGETELGLEETHGFGAQIKRHRIDGRSDAPYVDLVCLDEGAAQTFAAVAANITSVVAEEPVESRTSLVAATVREWRWFWGVDPSRMSANDAVGLFGELWFLHRWAGVTPSSIQAWEASTGSRHDFQWPTSSVEVKTTASGQRLHTIEDLDQLDDPVTGQLYLCSLRITRDMLASNSVQSLANAAIEALRSEPLSRSDLMSKLARRGYTPAVRDPSTTGYRVVEEGIYQVIDGFPRLTGKTFSPALPRGIDRVSYRLDMNACADWRIGAEPGDWKP